MIFRTPHSPSQMQRWPKSPFLTLFLQYTWGFTQREGRLSSPRDSLSIIQYRGKWSWTENMLCILKPAVINFGNVTFPPFALYFWKLCWCRHGRVQICWSSFSCYARRGESHEVSMKKWGNKRVAEQFVTLAKLISAELVPTGSILSVGSFAIDPGQQITLFISFWSCLCYCL